MQKQILVNGEWVDGNPTIDGQVYREKIPVGDGFGYVQLKFSTAIIPPSKMVGMTVLCEELDKEVLRQVRIMDVNSIDPITAQAENATQAILRIQINSQMDVFGEDFINMINMIGASTFLGADGAAALIAKMQA